MALISIYNLAEQVTARIGSDKIPYQSIIQACKNCYAKISFLAWTQGKLDGVSEVLGGSIYTFVDVNPVLDSSTNAYFAELPSTYAALPHDMGVVQISYMQGQTKPFVRMSAGLSGLFAGLLANALGNNQTYEITGGRMYFPKMQKNEVGPILMKLSVAFSDDPDEEINVAPNIAADIVDMVVAQFLPVPKTMPDTLIK